MNRAEAQLITELQSLGLRLEDAESGLAVRRGGAGPSDHKAVSIGGKTVMVPITTIGAANSPFTASAPDEHGISIIRRDGRVIDSIAFPRQPRFYGLKTADGVPYSHIATLHASDVLATTVLQSCIRYGNRMLRLRQAVFCEEQGVFQGNDIDEIDRVATPIVALACVGGLPDEVVGTVRIHQAEPGIWWGSRLAVAADYRATNLRRDIQ